MRSRSIYKAIYFVIVTITLLPEMQKAERTAQTTFRLKNLHQKKHKKTKKYKSKQEHPKMCKNTCKTKCLAQMAVPSFCISA